MKTKNIAADRKARVRAKLKYLARRHLAGLIAMVVGFLLVPPFLWLQSYVDIQSLAYSKALEVLTKGDVQDVITVAPAAFDDSLRAFEAARHRDWWQRFMLPPPDQEIAALALAQKGRLMGDMGQKDAALAAMIESLRLNSGESLITGVTGRDDDLHQYARQLCVDPFTLKPQPTKEPVSAESCQLLRLQVEANDTRHNIASLLRQKQKSGDGTGKPMANSKSGEGEGEQKAKSGKKKKDLPGKEPAPSGGHNDPDAI